MLASAGAPLPPSIELTGPVVLFFTPALTPVTSTVMVHDAVAAMTAPDRLMLLVPGLAVKVPPRQVVTAPLGVDTTRPAGSVSVKLTVSATVAFGFVMVKLRLLLPPTGIANRPKLLVVTGGATTVMLAEAVFPNPPSMDVTLLVVLLSTPATVPFTTMVNMHVPRGGSVIPLAVRTLAVKVSTVAGQDPADVTGPTAASPEGKVSVKPTPLNATVPFGFVIVKVRVVFWFSGTVGAANALWIIGGATTVIVAEAPVPALLLSLAVMLEVALFFTPGVRPTTVAVMIQVPPATIVALVMLMALGKPLNENAPQPVPTIEPVCDNPAGRVSRKTTPVRPSVAFGLVIVKVKLVDWPNCIVAAPNAFVIDGGAPAHGLGIVVLYCRVLPKSFVVTPGMSFPKLKTHDAPVPA